jgi:hypothetical protein
VRIGVPNRRLLGLNRRSDLVGESGANDARAVVKGGFGFGDCANRLNHCVRKQLIIIRRAREFTGENDAPSPSIGAELGGITSATAASAVGITGWAGTVAATSAIGAGVGGPSGA